MYKRNKKENPYNINENGDISDSSVSDFGNIQIYDNSTNQRIQNKRKQRPQTENPQSAKIKRKSQTAAYVTAGSRDTMDTSLSSKKTERTRLVEDSESNLTNSIKFSSDVFRYQSRVGRDVDINSVRWTPPLSINTDHNNTERFADINSVVSEKRFPIEKFQKETEETSFNSKRNCCSNAYCSIL